MSPRELLPRTPSNVTYNHYKRRKLAFEIIAKNLVRTQCYMTYAPFYQCHAFSNKKSLTDRFNTRTLVALETEKCGTQTRELLQRNVCQGVTLASLSTFL